MVKIPTLGHKDERTLLKDMTLPVRNTVELKFYIVTPKRMQSHNR